MEKKYRNYARMAARIVPKKAVRTDALYCKAWGTDAGVYSLTPKVTLFPETEDQVSELLALASDMDIPVTFRAAGTSLSGQAITDSVLIVCGDKWDKYSVDPDAEAVTFQPGVTGARAARILGPYGFCFTPDPASLKSAMVGGIIMNNASGMSCGTHANSDAMIVSARIVFADGSVLDTGDESSRAAFGARKPDFVRAVESLRDEIRANEGLSRRIRQKYAIKNVTGLNILPFVEHYDPFDIITHLMVGSEGTLGFISEATFKVAKIQPLRACAMAYFSDISEACRAVVAMSRLNAGDGRRTVASAEILDPEALACVGDTAGDGLTAILVETKAGTTEELAENVGKITGALNGLNLSVPLDFTTDGKKYSKWWDMRSGVFPAVGGSRKEGTTCLIEDVAFRCGDLAEAIAGLRDLFGKYGYDDACIYGHALEGNLHFILNQSFGTEEEARRYENMMDDLVSLVVDRFGGSLKAEHGTGRNMAPFVAREWGAEAFAVMKRVKEIFDPGEILNPGVIFNDDPRCHVKGFKRWPETYPVIDKCIECGFCETGCLTCGMTLSSRQRVVIRREIARAEMNGDMGYARELRKRYRYAGEQTCAGDGLCSMSCPMKINIGDLTHTLRRERMESSRMVRKVWNAAANNFRQVKSGLRLVLGGAGMLRRATGRKVMEAVTGFAHSVFRLPLWTPQMPGAVKQPGMAAAVNDAERYVVYFPSCINQTMGTTHGGNGQYVVDAMLELLAKAGYSAVFPEGMENLCCGTIWESKGMEDVADRKTAELEAALRKASDGGKYPVLCDQGPCLYRMRQKMEGLGLYEPVEFINKFLADRLDFTPLEETVSIHITCSARKMGLDGQFVELASRCARKVVVPEGVGCCGFAGDKGFTRPEVNVYALRKLRPVIEGNGVVSGYSNSRTCEIGLSTHSGVEYSSIACLVNRCTKAKNQDGFNEIITT